MTLKSITSWQNSKVKLVKRLRSKRGREQEGRFVIEGERDLQRALDQGIELDFLLTCAEATDGAFVETLHTAEIYQISPQMLNRLSYRENPGRIIAVLQSKSAKCLPELQQAAVNHAILLVDLRKPGNIGALLRTADATRLDAIILVDMSLDLYNPNIIRSSTGACFLDNVFQIGSGEAISYLKAEGFQLVAADVQGDMNLFDMNFQRKTAIVLGTEDKGLNRTWQANCDHLVHIPMNGRLADSLNVSVSGAIFMYEVLRQRHFGSPIFGQPQTEKARTGQGL